LDEEELDEGIGGPGQSDPSVDAMAGIDLEQVRPIPTYVVDPVVEPVPEGESLCHHLKDILERPSVKDVIVWETKRPIIELGLFRENPLTMPESEQRLYVVKALRYFFDKCPPLIIYFGSG
jgi:hypothetical protein